MFCLELKQEVFIIRENHVTLGHSACDVCVSVVVRFGDAAHRVQATDNFSLPSGTGMPEHDMGKQTLLSYFPCISSL